MELTTEQTFKISVPLNSLMGLSSDNEYLFFSYNWMPSFENKDRVQLTFTDYQEIAAVYHELWKLRVPGLLRNWA